MADWQDLLITDLADVRDILTESRRVVVLGIKPESRAGQPSHDVPRYLQVHGYEMIPAPTYYPEITEILGQPVVRDLTTIEAPVDVVDVFRRAEDIDAHVEDLLALRPKVVWFQLGIRNDAAAERLARAGIRVVQDRCMLADHKALL